MPLTDLNTDSRVRLSSMLSRREAMKIRGRIGVNETSNVTLQNINMSGDGFSSYSNQASRNQFEQTDLHSNSRNISLSVLDKSNEKERHSKQQRNITRSRGGVNMRSRSYSPSRSSPKEYHYISQEKDLFHSDDQLMYGLDGNRIEKMASDIDKCCQKIASTDSHSLLHLLDQAQKGISPIGFCHSHLWLSEPGGGLSSFEQERTHLNLSPLRTKEILDDAFATGSSSKFSRDKSQFRSAESFKCPGQVVPEDASWKDLVSLMRSCRSQSVIRHEKWTSIYIIPISADSIPSGSGGDSVGDSPSNDFVRGFIIAVEALPAVSVAVSRRSSYISETKVRRVMSLQWYKQIAAAVGIRLRSLRENIIPPSIGSKVEKNQVVSATGMLKFHADMGSVCDPRQVPLMLAHAGVHILGAPICFVLQSCTVQGYGSARSTAAVCDAHSTRMDSASDPASIEVSGPRLVENTGVVTSLLSAPRSVKHPTQRSRNQVQESCNTEDTLRSMQGNISATRFEVSRTELASLGLPVDKVRHGETWTLLCLQIPEHFRDRTDSDERSIQSSLHSGGSSTSTAGDNVGRRPWCLVLAAPSLSSSLSSYSSTAGVNSLRARDHGWNIDNAEILVNSRSLAAISSETFHRIDSNRESVFSENIRKLSVQLQNIADATVESAGTRSIHDLSSIQNMQTLSEIIESSEFSCVFNGEESFFLSSGTFLSSLDSVHGPRSEPEDQNKMSLIRLSSQESLHRQNEHVVGANSTWMRHLRCGMAVTVGQQAEGSSLSLESRERWGDELYAVLGNLSVGVRSALLVPVPCPLGLCVLVLVNRLPHTDTYTGIGSGSLGFSRLDVDSSLSCDLYRQVVRAVTATHTAHSARILKKQNIRLRVQLIGTQKGSVTGHVTDLDTSQDMVNTMVSRLRRGGSDTYSPHGSYTSSLSTRVAFRWEQGQKQEQDQRSDNTHQDAGAAAEGGIVGVIGGAELLPRLMECSQHFLKKHFPNDIVRVSSAREMIDIRSELAGSTALKSYISSANYADPGSIFSSVASGESADKVDALGDVLYVTMTRQSSDAPYTESEVQILLYNCWDFYLVHIRPYIYLFVSPSLSLSDFLSVSLSVRPCLSVCLPVSLSACISHIVTDRSIDITDVPVEPIISTTSRSEHSIYFKIIGGAMRDNLRSPFCRCIFN
jgi:hypothetical protein